MPIASRSARRREAMKRYSFFCTGTGSPLRAAPCQK